MQIPTQRYGRRPYGVGLLVAGYDVSRKGGSLYTFFYLPTFILTGSVSYESL